MANEQQRQKKRKNYMDDFNARPKGQIVQQLQPEKTNSGYKREQTNSFWDAVKGGSGGGYNRQFHSEQVSRTKQALRDAFSEDKKKRNPRNSTR